VVTIDKIKRSERLALLSRMLANSPGKLFSLSHCAQEMGCAKSSLSEDISILRDIFASRKLGSVETYAGALGGVVYRPYIGEDEADELVEQLRQLVVQPERVLPGGFLYLTDLVGNPDLMSRVGLFFARVFQHLKLDAILTVETKGIPIAMMTAWTLNLPLVIVRSDSRISEGTSVGISYVSGTQKRVVTMSLPKRGLAKGSRVVFIDDFLRRGGTASGVLELVAEFESLCVGMGFLIDIAGEDKLVHNYVSLLTLEMIDAESRSLVVSKGRHVFFT